MKPIVSVIVPVYYPRREYIDRLLDSIVRQTIGIEQLEVILVSDGDSSEATKEMLAAWESRFPKQLILIRYEENQGPGYARTLGMEYANGKYIAFADQDDWLSLEMYRVLTETAEREQYACYGWAYYPYIQYHYYEQGDTEKLALLEQMPERIRDMSWLDTIEGDLTEEELT